ncbi:MAG: hypothetical protein KF705_05510 [Phycisphaeraceae bacterium]|nr:hypothetical protein [Phycisphaeraceae bacterium]
MTARALGALVLLSFAATPVVLAPSASGLENQPAAAARSSLPEAASLFDRHVQGIGGIDAVRRHTSLKFTGTIKIPAMKYTAFTTIWQVAPASFAMYTEPPGGQRGEVYCDGTHAWEMMPLPDGSIRAVLYTDSRWTDTVYSASFYGDADYASRYSKVQTVELVDFNGSPAYKVFAEATVGKQLFLFFDERSGLIVGSHTVQNEGGQTIPVIMIYDAYREVDGVKYITGVTQRTPGGDVIISYRAIEANPSDVPLIELPAELRAQATQLGATPPDPEPDAPSSDQD